MRRRLRSRFCFFGVTAFLMIAVPAVAMPSPSGTLPASADSTGPKVTSQARYGAWGVSCAIARDRAGLARERCAMLQLVAVDRAAKKVIMGVTVDFFDAATVPTIHFRFTSRVAPKTAIGIKIDTQSEMRLPVNNCNAERCEASGRLSAPVLKRWSGARVAQVAYVTDGGKQVLVPVSLAGFDQALQALRIRHAALR